MILIIFVNQAQSKTKAFQKIHVQFTKNHIKFNVMINFLSQYSLRDPEILLTMLQIKSKFNIHYYIIFQEI